MRELSLAGAGRAIQEHMRSRLARAQHPEHARQAWRQLRIGIER